MAEYIEREAVERFIKNGLNNPNSNKAFGFDAIEILAKVHYMLSADVAPVVHARWIYEEETLATSSGYCCSACRRPKWTSPDVPEAFKYCPKCGAKMDGGGADD